MKLFEKLEGEVIFSFFQNCFNFWSNFGKIIAEIIVKT